MQSVQNANDNENNVKSLPLLLWALPQLLPSPDDNPVNLHQLPKPLTWSKSAKEVQSTDDSTVSNKMLAVTADRQQEAAAAAAAVATQGPQLHDANSAAAASPYSTAVAEEAAVAVKPSADLWQLIGSCLEAAHHNMMSYNGVQLIQIAAGLAKMFSYYTAVNAQYAQQPPATAIDQQSKLHGEVHSSQTSPAVKSSSSSGSMSSHHKAVAVSSKQHLQLWHVWQELLQRHVECATALWPSFTDTERQQLQRSYSQLGVPVRMLLNMEPKRAGAAR